MEKVENKAVSSGSKIEEFLAYDDKGNPVVLRRSVSLVKESEPKPAAGKAPTFGLVGRQEGTARPTGSMRFFAGFEEVKARLQAKLAAS